jgi:hypothetical protein
MIGFLLMPDSYSAVWTRLCSHHHYPALQPRASHFEAETRLPLTLQAYGERVLCQLLPLLESLA